MQTSNLHSNVTMEVAKSDDVERIFDFNNPSSFIKLSKYEENVIFFKYERRAKH